MQRHLFPPNEPTGSICPKQPVSQDNRPAQDGHRNGSANGGAKDAISRYSKLKADLDRDLFANGRWFEVDTRELGNEPCNATFADLFSGAGGISVGARWAGLHKVLSVEIDPDASNTIRQNFPDNRHLEMPIEAVTAELLDSALRDSRVNVMFGGPPCEGFSVAGLRNPQDPRNQLFRDYVRVVGYAKPDFVVMENVPGILSMDGGRVRDEIISQFAEIGYPEMSVRILEAAAFGVPQLRPRAIFVANRHGLPNPYPREILDRAEYRSIEDAIDDLKDAKRHDIANHEWTRHSSDFERRIAQVPPGGSLYETFRDAFKRQYRGVPSMAVKENHGGCHIHYELNRVLSAREMARLQTFPDDFIFSGRFKRVYWQVGNAVPCLLAYHVALAVRTQLEALHA